MIFNLFIVLQVVTVVSIMASMVRTMTQDQRPPVNLDVANLYTENNFGGRQAHIDMKPQKCYNLNEISMENNVNSVWAPYCVKIFDQRYCQGSHLELAISAGYCQRYLDRCWTNSIMSMMRC